MARFMAAATPKAVKRLRNDLEQESELRASAELEIQRLRLENEALRGGVKGDFDLDAWLAWNVEQRKLDAGDVTTAFEADERAFFEGWYLLQHYLADRGLIEIMANIFVRRGDGTYVMQDVQKEWSVWWARAISPRR